MNPTLIAALAATIAGPSPRAMPWGPEGHHLVARLAWTLLTPKAKARADSILDGSTVELAATWPDSIREHRLYSAPWHFVDIPLAQTTYDSVRDCKGGRCVISAINRFRRILVAPNSTPLERTEALKFIIHFVGDLHQPMHDANNNDRGGNQVQVHLNGRATNLHAVWDSGILTAHGETEDQYFNDLVQKLKAADTTSIKQGTLAEWAESSHALAKADAYHLPPNNDLGTAYVTSNIGVVEDQLLRAAVRLAKILNETLN